MGVCKMIVGWIWLVVFTSLREGGEPEEFIVSLLHRVHSGR